MQSIRMTAGVIVLAMAGVGFAVASATVSGADLAAAGPESDTSTTSLPDSTALADVVVTAQRQKQSVSDVPISITVIGGNDLAKLGVVNSNDLTVAVPGLKMDRAAGFNAPAIRGISTQLTEEGNDANVAIYVDDVYQPFQQVNSFDLPDIDRIEVLKGPQGTLYGRNATGGVIRIFTQQPSFAPTGQFSASYGSFNDRAFQGFLSGPLVDGKLAASISAKYEKSDGYLHDIVNDQDVGLTSKLVRVKFLAKPVAGLRFLLSGYYQDRDDPGAVTGFPLNGNTVAASTPGAIIATRPYDVAFNIYPKNEVRAYGTSLETNLESSAGTFTNVTAYTNATVTNQQPSGYAYSPAGGLIYNLTDPHNSFSSDFSWNSTPLGPVSYVLGADLSHARAAFYPINVLNDMAVPGPQSYAVTLYGDQRATAYAAFAEIYYDITSQFQAIGGLRYSYEERNVRGLGIPSLVTGTPPGPIYRYGDANFHSTTPRFSLRYKPADSTEVYFTYNEGFKSGGFNSAAIPFEPPPAGTVGPPVEPEKIRGYEIGVKARPQPWFDMSAAVFYYDYTDVQVNEYQVVNGVNLAVLQNAASAESYGLDLESTLRPIPELQIRGGLSLLHARYKDFPDAILLVPMPGGGNANVVADAGGKAMVRAPDSTVNLDVSYKKALQIGTIEVGASLYYTARFYFDSGDRVAQPSYTTLDARASYSPPNSGFTFSVYGRNLTDRLIYQGAFISNAADGISYGPPRTAGFTAAYNF